MIFLFCLRDFKNATSIRRYSIRTNVHVKKVEIMRKQIKTKLSDLDGFKREIRISWNWRIIMYLVKTISSVFVVGIRFTFGHYSEMACKIAYNSRYVQSNILFSSFHFCYSCRKTNKCIKIYHGMRAAADIAKTTDEAALDRRYFDASNVEWTMPRGILR